MNVQKVTYCANGCQRDNKPVQTTAPSQLCDRCERKFHRWLTNIADTWPKLPGFIEHGSTDRNPDSKATKSAVAPAPMRLEIIDLLDTRLGRKWNGTAAAHDRRSIAGDLQVHVERLMDERPLTALKHDHRDVAAAADLLDRHRLWISEQEWADLVYEDVRLINLALSNAIGEYRRPPVGKCHIVPEDTDLACRGNLYANDNGGVHCSKCQASWDAEHLRVLGLAQAQAASDLESA